MGKLRLRVFSLFIFILLTAALIIPIYYGWLGPSNEYSSYNAFPQLTFDHPVGFYQPKDDSTYNYVIEQAGRIKVFRNSPTATTIHTLLDISDRVYTSSEDGFLGLAFHPGFPTDNRIYTYHSELRDANKTLEGCDPCIKTMLTEYRVDPANPFRLLPNSSRVLLQLNQTAPYHRAGQLMFDRSGMLFIQTGDGTHASRAQELNNFFGKILRINVDVQQNGKPYGIQTDNPFYNQTGKLGEIYAYGLRNPWRGSIDPVTQNLWVGDVGKDYFEEIDLIQPGHNYGWPIYEGFGCKDNLPDCHLANTTFPVLAYPHPSKIPLSTASDNPVGVAVIGGHIYRGHHFPELTGNYIFGDYSGSLYRIQLTANNSVKKVSFIHKIAGFISQIGVDNKGEFYICSIYRGHILNLRQGSQVLFIIILSSYLLVNLLLLWKNFPEIFRKLKDQIGKLRN